MMILIRMIFLWVWLGPLTGMMIRWWTRVTFMISRWFIARSGCIALGLLVLGLFFCRRWKGSTIIWTSGESGWWWLNPASWLWPWPWQLYLLLHFPLLQLLWLWCVDTDAADDDDDELDLELGDERPGEIKKRRQKMWDNNKKRINCKQAQTIKMSINTYL